MFSFFKKKKPPEAEIVTEVTQPAPTPAAELPIEPQITVAADDAPRPAPLDVAPILTADAPVVAAKEELTDAFVPPSDLAQPQERPKLSWTERLKMGLAKTRDKLGKSLASVFGGGQINEDLYEELETVLLTADMGVDATQHLLKDVRERVSLKGLKDSGELKEALKSSLTDLIQPLEIPLKISGHKPFILMVAGVNGAGKTTSIGKLAKYYQSQGLSVLLAAGDTFRAAAREQLVVWGERNGVQVIAQASGDAAAVAFDAVNAAKARGVDVVIVDTAGRLPTQLHLMEEIKKVKRVVQKADPTGPHEVLLVLDANTGQNALAQVKSFDDALGLTGLVLTKLDGTAKGGVIAAIAKNRPVPLRFIGVGESIDDLRPFAAKDYIDALFE
ncbi:MULTISPECIES: signal recognition particle-docking protein FtsY [Deefgea]|uniref:Signal recognition particle receptor FtsY n=1 Tax=Deefgea chitinilytica TaxID=570276 RepID=A0ABS2CDI7_9NEIS|nr:MULTISPECIES: signal recognition particle-docking protein FtsY [Deefgea]MBM5572199.1 signal recognition particle-docking protein FtsY [Deefgea chitinilytica]MBM9889434.1 signal recognition particle-docking protein FtsY [Deefgea sp. CFH1-16]